MHRIYHNAYSREEVFESDKGNSIFVETMNKLVSHNWIVMDGSVSQHYLELFGRNAEMYIVPKMGVHTPFNSAKFISETDDISSLTPSIIGTHNIIMLAGGMVDSAQMTQKELKELEQQDMLVNLSSEAI